MRRRGAEAAVDRRATTYLWLATLAVFCIHLWVVSTRLAGPTVPFDENGYLGTARWLTGGAEWEMPFSPFFAVGYSLVIAPATLLTSPSAQWLAIGVINAALAASVLPLLALVLRRLVGATPLRALAGAAVGALAPAVLISGAGARADTLALPLVLVVVLAGWDALDRDRPAWRRILLGPAVAALLLTHSRYWPAVIVVAVVLLLATRRRADRPVALANLGLLALGIAAGQVLASAARSARWTIVDRPEGSASDLWSMLQSFDGIRELAVTALGQAWYLGVGSLGLAFVGIVLAVQGSTTRPGWTHARVVTTGIVVSAAGVFAVSVVFFSQNQFRADHYVYGRHNDSFTPLWIGLAVVYLLGRATDRAWRLVWSAAAIVALGGALVLLRDAAPGVEGFGETSVPALHPNDRRRPDGHVRAGDGDRAAAASLVVAALIAWGERRPTVRGRALVTRWASSPSRSARSGTGWRRGTRQGVLGPHLDGWSAEVFERLELDALCIDLAAQGSRPTLRYPWALPSVDARMYDSEHGEEPNCTFALAKIDDQARIGAGDRIAALDQFGLDNLAPRGSPSGWPRDPSRIASPTTDSSSRTGSPPSSPRQRRPRPSRSSIHRPSRSSWPPASRPRSTPR